MIFDGFSTKNILTYKILKDIGKIGKKKIYGYSTTVNMRLLQYNAEFIQMPDKVNVI